MSCVICDASWVEFSIRPQDIGKSPEEIIKNKSFHLPFTISGAVCMIESINALKLICMFLLSVSSLDIRDTVSAKNTVGDVLLKVILLN